MLLVVPGYTQPCCVAIPSSHVSRLLRNARDLKLVIVIPQQALRTLHPHRQRNTQHKTMKMAISYILYVCVPPKPSPSSNVHPSATAFMTSSSSASSVKHSKESSSESRDPSLPKETKRSSIDRCKPNNGEDNISVVKLRPDAQVSDESDSESGFPLSSICVA
jgi:hypothetical protein